MKKITITVDSEEDNEKIEYHVREWCNINFQNKAEIKIEDVD